MRSRSSIATSLIAVGLLISASACASREHAAGSGATGGTIIVEMGADAGTLFPMLVVDETAKAVTDLLFDHLAEISDSLSTVGDGGFTPRLATRWDWATDSMSIAFHLDPKARWHDGTPVRANDVRFSFRFVADPQANSPIASAMTNVDSISAKDSLTAVVWFKHHTPEEFYDVAYQLPIVPEHVYGSVSPKDLATSDLARHPVGSGRFRFVSWTPNQRLELVADTANYRGRAKLDRVVFVFQKEPSANKSQILLGQADLYEAFLPQEEHTLDSSRTARAIPYPQMSFGFVALNLRDPQAKTKQHPILGDRSVRRALSMAVDRAAILQNVFTSTRPMSHGPFPHALASADTTLHLLPFNVAAANALLDSAGWRRASPTGVRQRNGVPLRFKLLVPATSAARRAFAQLLQGEWQAVGAQVDLDQADGPAFMGRLYGGSFDAAMALFNVDPSLDGVQQTWATIGIGPNGQNVTHYSNPAVDALLDSAVKSFDPARMKSLASRAFQQIVDDAPGIWLYDGFNVAGVNRRIETAPLRADGWWAHLADWSVPADKRIDRDRLGLQSGKP